MERFGLSYQELLDTPTDLIDGMLSLMNAETLHRKKHDAFPERMDN